MHYVIYGAGAIGGVIGARLHQHGHAVTLIARGEHLQAIQRDGLRLRAPDEDLRLAIPAVGHPDEIDWRGDEAVLLTMKSQQTEAALAALRAAAGTGARVICTQNGVDNERMALRRFAHVYAMLVFLPAVHLEPGEVITHATGVGGTLDAGCYPGGTDDFIGTVTAALAASGFNARPDPAVMRLKYAKLLSNLNNALVAATEMSEGSEAIAARLRAEALAVYAAAGIDCAGEDEVRARNEGIRYAKVDGTRRGGGSTWQSIVRGTGDVETDWLNGEIALLGRLHGVPTPANAALAELGARMARERLAPGSIAPADLLARIDRTG